MAGYFTSVLGATALNMGVFVGIIAGFVGGTIYNKYCLLYTSFMVVEMYLEKINIKQIINFTLELLMNC